MLNSNSVKNIHPIINRAKEKSNALFHFTPLPGARDNNSALKERRQYHACAAAGQ
jgi:hypothetical protein